MVSSISIGRLWLLLVAIAAVFYLYGGFGTTRQSAGTLPMAAQHAMNPDLDETDALSSSQCSSLFPDLYQDVDRAVGYWRKRDHKITKEDLEFKSWREWDGANVGGGVLHILIHENELRIIESYGTMGHMGYRGRGMGFLYLLQRAIDSATSVGEKLPSIEALIVLQDISDPPEPTTHSFWTWTYSVKNETHQREWLIPNYDFWYAYPMGSYRESRRRAVQYDKPFTQKIQQVVWRGSEWVNVQLRGSLVAASKGKSWSDIVVADWGGMDSDKGLSVEELCQYAMTVHTEGISYSGRLKYLLNCRSLLIFHEPDWYTFDTHLMIRDGPKQNYVHVERDWSDLESKVEYYLQHPDEAEKVIANAVEAFREKAYTRAAISCYIRRLIEGYSTVAFEPEVHRPRKDGKTLYRRGISIERFLDSPMDHYFDGDDMK